MTPNKLLFSIAATVLLSSHTPAQDPEKVPPTVVTIEQPNLAGGLDDETRTVIATANAPAKTDEPRPIYEDNEFKIVAVSYGHAGDNPPQTPGFYVQGKKDQKWIRVEKVSLTDSVLGRSPTLAECREVGKNLPSVAWNFKSLAGQEYVDFPLKTSGSLLFPDKIERNDEKGRLILSFNSGWKIAGVETVLIVSLADLRKCLDENFLRNQ
ncbi:MAG: hypothetical protein K9N23_03170 [Akkermansiaceae bacterium]|nr:hypothetical protein [Akkermansiaceae bacterium]